MNEEKTASAFGWRIYGLGVMALGMVCLAWGDFDPGQPAPSMNAAAAWAKAVRSGRSLGTGCPGSKSPNARQTRRSRWFSPIWWVSQRGRCKSVTTRLSSCCGEWRGPLNRHCWMPAVISSNGWATASRGATRGARNRACHTARQQP